jgi:hypothetical protein
MSHSLVEKLQGIFHPLGTFQPFLYTEYHITNLKTTTNSVFTKLYNILYIITLSVSNRK